MGGRGIVGTLALGAVGLVALSCSSDDGDPTFTSTPVGSEIVPTSGVDADGADGTESSSGGSDATEEDPGATRATVVVPARATITHLDLQPTGNRVAVGGPAALTGPPTDEIELGGGEPRWVFGLGGEGPDRRWVVIDAEGAATVVAPDGGAEPLTTIGDAAPVTVETDDDGVVDILTADDRRRGSADQAVSFGDPLPDTRTVFSGPSAFGLGGPTDRYAHGVLGDVFEASTVEAVDADGTVRTVLTIDEPDVFEAVSPMLADVDGDGNDDVLVTASNASTGARLVVVRQDGSPLAETDPIGRGNRWRNLLGVAPLGPDGEIEVVDVITPHIGGIVAFHRYDAESGRLERVASTAEYSTHSIGSRNLDQGIIVDADGDERLDVVVPTQSRDTLAVLTRTADEPGIAETFRVDLGDRLTTNIAATTLADGSVEIAVAAADGRLLVWSP